MDYRPYILAGTFLLLVVAIIVFVATLVRSRRERQAANRYGYAVPEVGPAKPGQPIDTDLAGLEVTVDAEAPSAALLTPLRTGEWMPPESPAPAASLGGVSLEERIADFRPVPDVREPDFAVDAYQSWEVGDDASAPVAASADQEWAAGVPEVRREDEVDEGDDFGEEIRALLPSPEGEAPQAQPASAPPTAPMPTAPETPPNPVAPAVMQPVPEPPSTAAVAPTVPLLPSSGVMPGSLVPQSVPVIEAPALVVPPAVTIDPAVLAQAIAQASAAAVAAAQPAVAPPAPSVPIAPAEPVVDLSAAYAATPVPVAPTPVAPTPVETPASPPAASPSHAQPEPVLTVEAPAPVEEVQEWVDMVRETQGEAPRPVASAPPAVPRPPVSVATPPAPASAAPTPAAGVTARKKSRPSVRVHGVEQVQQETSEHVRLAPAPKAATARDQVEDIVMAAPVEMWFGDARVGVKAGTATYDRFRKYADVLLDDLKALRASSR